jgi:hypothetical protein
MTNLRFAKNMKATLDAYLILLDLANQGGEERTLALLKHLSIDLTEYAQTVKSVGLPHLAAQLVNLAAATQDTEGKVFRVYLSQSLSSLSESIRVY